MSETPLPARTDRVVLLAGPSGAGKSRLASRLAAAYGWPIVNLDDFYREETDPDLPRSADLGIIDWDDPGTWHAEAAVAALARLIGTGVTECPTYDISRSRISGTTTTRSRPGDLILAEGIFAAEIVAPLRAQGLLHSAWCVRNHPVLTMVRRLARDLNEHRKPPLVLLRRGVALLRAEPAVVERARGLGARPATAKEVARALAP